MTALRTVTLLFTDIEGSTGLVRRLGADWGDVLDRHQALVRDALAAHRGTEVDTEGDAFFAVFDSAADALAAAAAVHAALATEPWPGGVAIRLRIGVHTGLVEQRGARYLGLDVHTAARVGAAAHGGQTIASAATVALAQPAGATDLGEHRLKDIPAPLRLHQVGPGTFPAPRTLDARYVAVPAAAGPDPIGREADLERIEALWAGGARHVTVLGPPGVGKTTLALVLARRAAVRRERDIVHVALEQARSSEEAWPLLAAALAVEDEDAVLAHLAARPTLVVLDNTEQLSGAGGLVERVLAAGAGTQVLVTSQARTGAEGEHVVPLAPLGTPSGDTVAELLAAPAGQILVRELRAVDAAFEPTEPTAGPLAAICRRLEGNPLALGLVAARSRTLTPDQLWRRLDDALGLLRRRGEGRHSSLLAALEWTVSLLSEEATTLLGGLGVLQGPFPAELVEELGAGLLDDPLWVLDELVSLSLVRRVAQERLELLPSVQALSRRRLAADAALEAAWWPALGRHLLAAGWDPPTELDVELLLPALAWLRERDPDLHLRLVERTVEELNNSPTTVAEIEVRAAVAEADRAGAGPLRAGLLQAGLANIVYKLGRLEVATAVGERAEELLSQAGEVDARARNLSTVASFHAVLGEPADSLGYLDRCDEVLAAAGRPPSLMGLLVRGQLVVATQDAEGARGLQDRLDQVPADTASAEEWTWTQHLAADCELLWGAADRAVLRYGLALRSGLEHRYLRQCTAEMQGAAMALGRQGRHEDGLRLLGAAARILDDLGDGAGAEWWDALIEAHLLEPAGRSLSADRIAGLRAAGLALTSAEAIALGLELTVD